MPNVMERFQWFTKEISSTNVRLMQLGMEAEDVVKEMEQMFKEAGEEIGDGLKQFKNVVINAKKGVICGKIEEKCRSKKRCRYWNRGYCREGSTKCPFYHPPDDCQQHLAEGHCSSQGCDQRHRKRCKYWGTHWSAEAEVRNEKSPNGRLCSKERSWRGLQFDVCVNNITWRNIE